MPRKTTVNQQSKLIYRAPCVAKASQKCCQQQRESSKCTGLSNAVSVCSYVFNKLVSKQ